MSPTRHPVDAAIDVCVLGSANLDLVATATRIPRPGETVLGIDYAEHAGGKGLNQAVASARSGARVAFVGALGADDAGRRLRGVMHGDGIDDRCVVDVDTPTGRAMIVVAADGENSIVVIPGANALVRVDALPDASVLLCQLEVPLTVIAHSLREARRRGVMTVLNPAPARALDPGVLGDCDVVIPNEHEIDILGGPGAVLAAGAGAVLVTRGADGVEVHTPGDVTYVPSFEVDVVDTTGAGDAFCGALAARLAAGDDLAVAARWAAAAGALATTVRGAVPAQPFAEQIRRLLDGTRQPADW